MRQRKKNIMKDNKIKITPDMLPKVGDYIDLDNVELPTKEQQKEFKKSEAYKKYVQPTLDREKALKKEQRKEWWWTKGLGLINLAVALVAAITGIISILK